MRFEVPQFIEVEDKIFGPFTWKQFIYIAGGAGAAVILYLVLPFTLFIFIGGPIIALAGFLAFHRINNRPFSIFLESFVRYFTGKKMYYWQRKHQQTITAKKPDTPVSEPLSPPTQQSRLADLSSKLELNTLEPDE